MSTQSTLYKVRYLKNEEARLGHVKAFSQREAEVKARRFVISEGSVVSVVEA